MAHPSKPHTANTMAEIIAAAPPHRALKDWFLPCTRLPPGTFPPVLQQVELILDEGVSETTWSWEELYPFTRNKIVWFGPTGYINGTGTPSWSSGDYRRILRISWSSCFDEDDERDEHINFVALSTAQGMAACDLCIQSLSCDYDKVCLAGVFTPGYAAPLPVSGRALSQFIAQGRGLGRLQIFDFELEEEHCRTIVSETSAETEISLWGCKPTDAGFGVLLQGFRDNRGPTQLMYCFIDYVLLADALQGNSSIDQLGPVTATLGGESLSNEAMCALLRAVTESPGMSMLDLDSHPFDDDTWDVMCQSLARHPTIFDLSLLNTLPVGEADATDGTVLEARKTRRTQALVDMMRVNKVISSIDLDRGEYDEQLYDQEIKPRLRLNEYRPHIQHLKKVEVSQREPLLGRALHTHNDNSTLLYLLLRGNTDIDWAARRRTRRSRKRVRYTK